MSVSCPCFEHRYLQKHVLLPLDRAYTRSMSTFARTFLLCAAAAAFKCALCLQCALTNRSCAVCDDVRYN